MASRTQVALCRLGFKFLKLAQPQLCRPFPSHFSRCRRIHRSVALESIEVTMPSLSPTMTEGTIVKWLKKEGDPLAPGDVLCEIQTDKAVVALETDEEGTLAKILLPDDSKDIKVGTLIAIMASEGEDWKAVEVPATAAPVATASSVQTPPSPPVASEPHASGVGGGPSPSNFGPAVRFLLEEYGLQPAAIPASGPHRVLLKGDVLKYIADNSLKPIPVKAELKAESLTESSDTKLPTSDKVTKPRRKVGVPYIDIELSSMRKTIAKRLTESKTTIPHSYVTATTNIDSILNLRKQLKADGVNTSVNDFVIKAAGVALRQCPFVNVIWKENQAIAVNEVDISVAVATDSGLITPIVRNVPSKQISSISSSVRDLAARARDGKLRPDEFQGGSFTISNLGMFGIKEFTAIINPPQCAILAVGAGIKEIDENGVFRTRMRSTLSYDARAVAENEAAEFMATLSAVLENPSLLLIGSVTAESAIGDSALNS